jgi:hypothetical protein
MALNKTEQTQKLNHQEREEMLTVLKSVHKSSFKRWALFTQLDTRLDI